MCMAKTHIDSRSRLVSAAVGLAYQNGFAATSLADIAREAEVPLGNVYYYFKTKDEIGEAIVERRLAQLSAQRRSSLNTWPGSRASFGHSGRGKTPTALPCICFPPCKAFRSWLMRFMTPVLWRRRPSASRVGFEACDTPGGLNPPIVYSETARQHHKSPG